MCFWLTGIVLFTALTWMNPVSGSALDSPPYHEMWTGVQTQGFPFPDYSLNIEHHGKVMMVKMSGIRMDTVSGYSFGDIQVAYEKMDNVTIIFTTEGLPYPGNPLNIMYLYPHHGKITWYDAAGNVVGMGTFGSRGGNVGSLVVNGLNLHVEGRYGLWVGDDPTLVGHTGWYLIRP